MTETKNEEALEHNLSYQKTIISNINTLKKILIENSEKQRLLKCKISKYDLQKFIGGVRGPKRFDFFQIPHWMYDTMDEETGTIAPMENNIDMKIYSQKLPNFQIDHTLSKFSLTEQRNLSKAIANSIRLLYLKNLHNKFRNDTRKLQEELNKIRIKDNKNELWPLKHWKEYSIPWQLIANEHMQGRSASECKVFWNGHFCLDNPNINRTKTWKKAENTKLLNTVTKYNEYNWIDIATAHNFNRTPLQCISQWMRKVKPRVKIDRKWKREEDQLLKDLVFKHGKNNFLYIGSHFSNRTSLQCSSRWLKSTAPYIRSGEWDTLEDLQCVLSHNSYLPKYIPIINRNSNRFEPIMNKQKGKHGVWVLIGRHITYRNDVKGRERYMNVLNPDIDIQSRWTKMEDNNLIKYHKEFGDKWALIARKLGTNRTDCYCRQRHKALMKKNNGTGIGDFVVDLTEGGGGNGVEEVVVLDCEVPKKVSKKKAKKIKKKSKSKSKSKSKPKLSKKMKNKNMRKLVPRKRKRKSRVDGFVVSDEIDDEYYPDYIEQPKKKKVKKNVKRKKKDKRKVIKVKCIANGMNNRNEFGIVTRSKSRGNVNRFKPQYLVTNFNENRPFMGTKPNKFILNQKDKNNEDGYVIPMVNNSNNNSNNNSDSGFRILCSDKNDNYIDKFIENNDEYDEYNDYIPPLPIICDNEVDNNSNNNIKASLSGQLPMNVTSDINNNQSQCSNMIMPRFQPLRMLNPFQNAVNSVINENTFKISFPLNNYKKNYVTSAPPQSQSQGLLREIPQLIPINNNKNNNHKSDLVSMETNVEKEQQK